MSILGLDNGYHYTKTSENIILASTIKKGKDIDINTDTIQVNLNNFDYVVGDNNGQYVADGNKIESLVTEVCTMTAIAKSFPEETKIDVNIVAGLPVSYYSKQKDAFKERLLNYGQQKIKIGAKEQYIKIQDVLIYPQSAGVVFMNAKDLKKDSSLIIDIGGGTWDVSEFNGLKMEEKATYQEGQLVLYSKLAQKLNSEYECKFKNYELDSLLKRGYITVEGNRINLDILNDMIEAHVDSVITDIKRDFSYKNVDNIFIIGGGGMRLYDKITNHFSNAVLVDDPQFVNAKAFELMGQMKFR